MFNAGRKIVRFVYAGAGVTCLYTANQLIKVFITQAPYNPEFLRQQIIQLKVACIHYAVGHIAVLVADELVETKFALKQNFAAKISFSGSVFRLLSNSLMKKGLVSNSLSLPGRSSRLYRLFVSKKIEAFFVRSPPAV